MAHKTRVGGTNYGISGGKCRVSGTNYSIKKGRTKVGGTNYDINFGPLITLKIRFVNGYDDGRANQSYVCYAEVNGVQYTSDVDLQVSPDTVVNYYVSRGSNGTRSWSSTLEIYYGGTMYDYLPADAAGRYTFWDEATEEFIFSFIYYIGADD